MSSGTRHAEARTRLWGAPVPLHLKHGTNTWAATVYGCDCKHCLPSGRRKRKAWRGERSLTSRERQARSRENLRGRPVPPGTKHGIYAYTAYRCRCDVCVEAKWVKSHRQNNPWMYRLTRGRWREENGVTTLCWPPATAEPDWKCDCEVG